jgi:hypothetical protein
LNATGGATHNVVLPTPGTTAPVIAAVAPPVIVPTPAPTTPTTTATEPAIPAKLYNADGTLKSAQEIAKIYANLETLLGKQGKVAPTEAAAAPAAPAVSLEIPKDPPKAVETAGAKPAVSRILDGFVEEFSKGNGQLSAESLANLTAQGVDPQDITEILSLKVTQRAAAVNEIAAVVGGVDNVNKLLKFATTFSPENKVTLDKMLKSGDADLQKSALVTINGAWVKAYGQDVNFQNANGTANGSNGFRNLDEQTKAMNDPKYKNDPAYQAQVHARIATKTF